MDLLFFMGAIFLSLNFRHCVCLCCLFCLSRFSFASIAVAYDIGFIMIAIRFVASVAGNLVSLFQLDAPQMPGPLSRFDPLHNAYLGTVLLEAQLQLESMEESQ